MVVKGHNIPQFFKLKLGGGGGSDSLIKAGTDVQEGQVNARQNLFKKNPEPND